MIFSYDLFAKWRATCIDIRIPIVLQIQIPVRVAAHRLLLSGACLKLPLKVKSCRIAHIL